jgi:protein phosphatase
VLRACGSTDRGRVRPINEDYFATDEELRLCVVADGMGGHKAGEVAARIAVDAVADFVADVQSRQRQMRRSQTYDRSLSEAGHLVHGAIQHANEQILEAARSSHAYEGMGTTIVAGLVIGDRLAVGHVGDSRLYLLSRGRLRQLTHDDSWMATVLAHDPDANPGELQLHPMRNALTNVVGSRTRTEVHVAEERLTGGELLLLSTDGVHGVIEERRLQRLLLDGEADLAKAARYIVQAAMKAGSRDNCTAVVARYYPD